MLDRDLMSSRELNTCIALTNADVESLSVSNPIEFLHDKNERVNGKPVALLATTGVDDRDHVTVDDVYRCRRYEIDKISRFNGIHPRFEVIEMECPICGSRYFNSHPLYLLDSCVKSCNVSVSKMIVTRKGKMVDVGSGTLVINSGTRGKQVVPFYIDRDNLDINRNYSKLQLGASGAGNLSIDAVPFVEWTGNDKFVTSLWVTRAIIVPRALPPSSPSPREIEFTIDVVPSDEKGTVTAVFFKNLEFMRFYLGFDTYCPRSAFPDFIAKRHDGTKIIIEFEFDSANFDKHGHDPSIVDYIVCWSDSRTTEDDVKVIALSGLVGKKIKVDW